MLNYSAIDNSISSSRMAIGESSNVAQIALTYSYNFDDEKYVDYVCILSVLAQVAIDSAKRRFDIDITNELNSIKADMDIKQIGYPIFWKHIKDAKAKDKKNRFNINKINKELICPMNYVSELKFNSSRSSESTLPMDYFFNRFEIDENRRKSKKIESMIDTYSMDLYKNYMLGDRDKNCEDYILLMANFEDMIEDIKSSYMSSQYIGLMSWIIDRTFLITSNIKRNKDSIDTKVESNKSILLSVLYQSNKESLLKIFSKNAPNIVHLD
jgi:hypothetical protein